MITLPAIRRALQRLLVAAVPARLPLLQGPVLRPSSRSNGVVLETICLCYEHLLSKNGIGRKRLGRCDREAK